MGVEIRQETKRPDDDMARKMRTECWYNNFDNLSNCYLNLHLRSSNGKRCISHLGGTTMKNCILLYDNLISIKGSDRRRLKYGMIRLQVGLWLECT